jgi:hypothetical protein
MPRHGIPPRENLAAYVATVFFHLFFQSGIGLDQVIDVIGKAVECSILRTWAELTFRLVTVAMFEEVAEDVFRFAFLRVVNAVSAAEWLVLASNFFDPKGFQDA